MPWSASSTCDCTTTQYRELGHQYHRLIQASQHHQTAPQITVPAGLYGGFSVVTGLVGLLTIGAVVVACIWQYRAASTARAMGLPAKHSPGWGVGCWFVPIVNYWMPYQALRDCLPVEDPHRSVVKWFWFFFIGQGLFMLMTVVSVFFSTSLSLAFAIPAALLCLGWLATAPRFVAAVASAHRVALVADGTGTPITR